MWMRFLSLLTFATLFVTQAFAGPPSFKKVLIVIFENEDATPALQQPAFAQFARRGAYLNQFFAETHPSQGNYIAMTSGNTYGVNHDGIVNLNVKHIGDLLEARGKSWKIYLESYPGGCFQGGSQGTYVRKHNPFISYINVQRTPAACARLVPAAQLDIDAQRGALPEYAIYVPDMNNNGHDTGVAFADRWFGRTFGPRLADRRFMQDLLVVATFDESGPLGGNRIYTALVGDSVTTGAVSQIRYDHYSLLRTIEDTFGLGNLGQNDARALPITGVWK